MPIELLQSGYFGTISYSKRNVSIRGGIFSNFSKVFRDEITLQSARQSQEVKQALDDYRYQRDVEFKAMKITERTRKNYERTENFYNSVLFKMSLL